LHAINWNIKREASEAMSLLSSWTACDFGDALHLLSSAFCANEHYNKKNKKP
jgi:hypothetical protein